MADKKPKKFTAMELASTAVKEIASAVGRKAGGAAGNAARVVSARSNRPEGMPDANTYRSRQFTDDSN